MYWITGILGVILAVAPFVFGYSDNTPALLTSLLVGGTTILVSWIEAGQEDNEKWEYWTIGILGLATVAAPFALRFSSLTSATWTSVIVGILFALFAGSRLTSEQESKI